MKIKKLMMAGMAAGAMMLTTVPAYAEEDVEMAGAYEAYMEEGIPEDAREAYDKATENFEGAEYYTPIQLVETQIVAGMNYRILCDEKEHDDIAAHKLMVTIYKDLDGNCEVMMEQKVITPMVQMFDTETKDFMTNVRFEANDFNWDDQTLSFELYDTALYDMVDMARLESGSVIEVGGRYVTIDYMEEGECIHRFEDGTEEKAACLTINKDEPTEAFFMAYEGGCWISMHENDAIDTVKIGEMTLPFSDTLKFTDFDPMGRPGENLDIAFEELKDYMEGMTDSYLGLYDPLSTKIEVENGEIVSIVRTWRP